MANRVSYSFIAVDRFTRIAEKVGRKARGVADRMQTVRKESRKANESLRELGSGVRSVGLKMTALSAAIVATGIAAISQSAKFEQLEVAFQTLAGSAEEGTALFEKLTKFAASTPFQLEGIAQSAQTLLAFGVQSEDIEDTIRRLGDMAAGTGKPLNEFALIFGKIKAKGKITGEELQQLAEKGVNLREALGRKFSLNAEQVEKRISKGQITFEHVRDVLVDMTSEGGRFFGLMEKQSKTTAGLWSTLKDNIALAADALGDALVEIGGVKSLLERTIGFVSAFAKRFRAFAEAHPQIVKMAIAITAVVVVLGPLIFALGAVLGIVAAMQTALAVLGVSFAAVAAVVLPLIAAFGLLLAAGVMIALNWKEIRLFFVLLWGDIQEFVASIPALVGGMVSAIGTKIEELKDRFVGFFTTGKIGAVLEFLGVDTGGGASVDVNVNLAGPPGSVESATVETRGSANLEGGLNLEPGLG